MCAEKGEVEAAREIFAKVIVVVLVIFIIIIVVIIVVVVIVIVVGSRSWFV